jgi:hypothetical protein
MALVVPNALFFGSVLKFLFLYAPLSIGFLSSAYFYIVQASAIQNNIIDVDFNVPPLAINPNNANDALNPANWALSDSRGNKIFIASISVPIFNPALQTNNGISSGSNLTNIKNGLSLFLTTASALSASTTYTLTASSNLQGQNGTRITGTLVWTFAGLYSTEVVTYITNLIGNDLSYDFINNDITATIDGDWDVMTGIPQIKKKILRRLTTAPGAFFHLPNFGVSIPSKTMLLPSKILKMQKDLRRQIVQEPGVVDANVTITSNSDGNLFVSAVVKTSATESFEIGVIKL